jgi:PAS domain S-box-containing protein
MLRATVERYRTFIGVTGELAWTTNADGEVLEDIPSFRKFTGQTYEEVKGWGWTNALHPDDLERTKRTWKEANRSKTKYAIEYRLRRHDGVYRYFMARGVPVFGEGGSVREWVGTCIDITERKKVEEELKSSEDRLRILFDCAPDAYYLSDLRGNFVDGNRAAEELTGYKRDELIGKTFLKSNILPRNQIPKAAKLLALNALGKSTGPDEFVLNRRDGTRVQVEIKTYPVKIRDERLVLGIARDITQRKEKEKLALENEQRFRSLFSGNPEATAYLDPEFRICDINERFTSLFGYCLDEVKGKCIDDLIVPKDKIEEAETLDKKAAEEYTYRDTVRIRKDGSPVWVSIAAASIIVEGKLKGYVGVYKDISQLKEAERKLTNTMEKLAVTNEKLRVVGGLTRHDIRNKLTAVSGNVYLARKQLPENSPVLANLEQISASVQQTVRILAFAKAYEMLGAEELSYVDVEKAVSEAVSLFSSLKNVKVVNECRGLTVLADSLLRQLFYNLIDNSLKYGERLTEVKIRCEEKEDYLNMFYEDDGVGIPQASKSRLFSEGYTTGKGSGYGLYLIKKMTEVYGWAIMENGEPEKGARFVMTIPKTNESGRPNYMLH